MNVFAVVLVGLALLAALFVGWQMRRFFERIEALEAATRKRKFPFRGMEGLEDAVAIGLDVRQQNDDVDAFIDALAMMLLRSEAMRKYSDARIAQMMEILRQVRRDPHSYDSTRPDLGEQLKKEAGL